MEQSGRGDNCHVQQSAGRGGGVTASYTFTYTSPTERAETWIIIPGDIRILKQFWDASVFIRNNTTLPINNTVATLQVPDGLALPDLFDAPQPNIQRLGTIDPMSQKQASWVTRGDKAGKYKLTGTATGQLQLGGASISLNDSLKSDEFEVITPKINVSFKTPSSVAAGADFTIGITIANPNSIDLNGVTVNIKAEKLVNCVLAKSEAASKFLGVIPVGQSAYVEFRFTSLVTGIVEEVHAHISSLPLEPGVTVTPTQILPPVANDDYATTAQDTPIRIPVLANDADAQSYPLTVLAVTQGEHGAVVINPDTTVTYTPQAGYRGANLFVYQIADGHGNTDIATVSLAVGAVAVSGAVTLESCVAETGQIITLEFRPTDGAGNFTRNVTLDAVCAFSVSNVPARQYNLAIKGSKWLRRVVSADASNDSDIPSITVMLLAGDANNDNSVDATDFGILVSAYNTAASVPGSGYDIRADFNCDGSVDPTDFGLLVGNYGSVGAP